MGNEECNTEKIINAHIGSIENSVINNILNSPVLKYGRWLMMLFMVFGLAVWGIGSWSNKANITSLKHETDETINKIVETKKEILKLENDTTKIFNEKKDFIEKISNDLKLDADRASEKIDQYHKNTALIYGKDGKDLLDSLVTSLEKEIDITKSKAEDIEKETRIIIDKVKNRNKNMLLEVDKMNNEVKLALDSLIIINTNLKKEFFTSPIGITALGILFLLVISLILSIISLVKNSRPQ